MAARLIELLETHKAERLHAHLRFAKRTTSMIVGEQMIGGNRNINGFESGRWCVRGCVPTLESMWTCFH